MNINDVEKKMRRIIVSGEGKVESGWEQNTVNEAYTTFLKTHADTRVYLPSYWHK